jgi:hypothetical protein
MERFPLGILAEELLRAQLAFALVANPGTPPDTRETAVQEMRKRIPEMRDFLARFGFGSAHHNAVLLVGVVNNPNPGQEWAAAGTARLGELYLGLISDLKAQAFFHVRQDLAMFYERDLPLGDVAASAFPAASTEIKEAGTCYALGRDTASVFFLMRAMTLAVQAIAANLGVARKIRLVEPEGTILNHIEGKIKRRLQRLAPEKKRKSAARRHFEELSELSLRLLRAKDAWRSSMAHARMSYGPTEAIRVLVAVQDMIDLAVKLRMREAPRES